MAGYAIIYVTPIVQSIEGSCPTCGYDALERVKLCSMTGAGVSTMSDQVICGRCEGEER